MERTGPGGNLYIVYILTLIVCDALYSGLTDGDADGSEPYDLDSQWQERTDGRIVCLLFEVRVADGALISGNVFIGPETGESA